MLDHPGQLAVMHSLVRFANIAAGGSITNADLYAPALDALGVAESQYTVASFRYDLSKLRANAPLTAPFRGDRSLAGEKRCQLDRLYGPNNGDYIVDKLADSR